MKKIFIISATLKNNYKLSEDIRNILTDMDVETSLLSLEDYMLPLYTDNMLSKKKESIKRVFSLYISIFLVNSCFVNNKKNTTSY